MSEVLGFPDSCQLPNDTHGVLAGGVNLIATFMNGVGPIMLPEHRHKFWQQQTGWELERLDHMSSTINADSRVMYIGAEEGDMPALLAQFGAQLFMVEPNLKVWPNIKAIWEANNLATPYTYPGFCGAEPNRWFTPPTFGWPSCAGGPIITDHSFPSLLSAGETPVATVDKFSSWNPTVLAIDVEGAEWDVLHGAQQTLLTFGPDIYLSLHPEFMWHDYKHYSADLRYWLHDLGYREELIAYPPHEAHFFYHKER